ncbi:MAG: DUF1993 family protein, partial [Beijerinckiaceae bacterium]
MSKSIPSERLMQMSLHAASVPVFCQMLDALEAVLRKAESHAEARKIAPDVMLGLRLAP